MDWIYNLDEEEELAMPLKILVWITDDWLVFLFNWSREDYKMSTVDGGDRTKSSDSDIMEYLLFNNNQCSATT